MRCWKKIALTLSVMIGFSMISFASAQAKTFEFKFSHQQVSTHKGYQIAAAWAKEIEKRTKGEVRIKMYPGSTLTAPQQNYDGVVEGLSDIGSSWFGFNRGRFPVMEALDMPLGYRSALGATLMANELIKKFRPKELEDVEVMYVIMHGPGIIHTKDKPVRKLEDLKGLKIRCAGSTAGYVKALGAAPVAMQMGDTYDGLSRGVVDGAIQGYETLEQWKLAEVLHYSTENFRSAYAMVQFLVMNKNKWNSLPANIKKTIEEINEEWIWRAGMVWDKIEVEGKIYTIKLGNTVIPLSEEEDERWQKAVEPLIEKYIGYAKEKGVENGRAIINFAQERLEVLQSIPAYNVLWND